MNKTDAEVVAAIEKAKPGISKYLAIMDRLYSVNVSTDADFQRMYNGFYKMGQKPQDWYAAYYELLEKSKGSRPSFKAVIEYNYAKFQRCEASFSSKLVATLDPWKPIWDKYVIENVNPDADEGAVTKIDVAIARYAEIQQWYSSFLQTDDGKRWVGLFNQNVPIYFRISDIKKVDFILWQMREGG